jgi:pilus assembly protein CpaB
MNKRALAVLTAAAVFGVLTVMMARGLVRDGVEPAEAAKPTTTPVVVAKSRLDFGNALATTNLKIIQWPIGAVPAGSFATVEELTKTDERRVAIRSIEPDEPILAAKISGPDGRGTLSMVIAEGMRAATIRIDDVNGVAGFVLPGDRVDVMITRREAGRGDEQSITQILLQSVKVLAVDQTNNDRSEGAVVARAATLEVTPEQAQKLTLGSTVGKLSLALRNQGQQEVATFRTITVKDLGGDMNRDTVPAKSTVPAAPRTTPPPKKTIRVIRGMEVTETDLKR